MTSPAAGSAPTDLYLDFLCPYAWRGVELADVLRRERGLSFRLRHFSLVQGNHPGNPERKQPAWWLSDQPAGEGSDAQAGSLNAFLAAQAALRQGEEGAWAFTLALLRLRHQGKADLRDDRVIREAAGGTLDPARLAADLQGDAGLREALRRDLEDSAALGVFGTPTFVLPGGHAAYFRFAGLVREPGAALKLWELYSQVLTDGARIETIKRPR